MTVFKTLHISFLALAVAVKIAFAQNPTPYRESKVVSHFVKPAHLDPGKDILRKLKVPRGFKVSVFARDLGHARMMLPEGDLLYVSDPKNGEIFTLSSKTGGDKKQVISGVDQVNGMVMHEGTLYFIATTKIYAFDPSSPSTPPQVLVDHLPDAGQHPNRVIHEGPDGLLYASIGSTCNSCADANRENATLQRMRFDGSERKVVAKGLRDTMGFDWQQGSRTLFGMDHGVDGRGDALPPEELNEIKEGGNYGWPYCWGDRHPDNNLIDDPKDMSKEKYCKTTEAPVFTFTAHSAPIDFKFYDGPMFPAEFKTSAFVTMHGSWNRKPASGYSVLRVIFNKGKAVRSEEFLTGFLVNGGKSQLGRPAGLAVLNDGSLLVSDDENGIIYRITHI